MRSVHNRCDVLEALEDADLEMLRQRTSAARDMGLLSGTSLSIHAMQHGELLDAEVRSGEM